MTNKEIFQTAMRQSAYDINCRPQDFLSDTPVIVESYIGDRARKYYHEPISCNLVSYGSNIVASVKPEYRDIVSTYIQKFECCHCFETPNMHWLNERLQGLGQKVCFMAEYFLPDITKIKKLSCTYELKIQKTGNCIGFGEPSGC